MAESIQKLRIYQLALGAEDQVIELVRALPPEQAYPLGNSLRRAAAGACHHISLAHQHYSYTLKLQDLAEAREQAEQVRGLLGQLPASAPVNELLETYLTVIKQSWGLSKYLKQRQAERQSQAKVQAADELVAARS